MHALAPEKSSAFKKKLQRMLKLQKLLFLFVLPFANHLSLQLERELKIENKCPSWNWISVLARQLYIYFCAGRNHSYFVLVSPPLRRAYYSLFSHCVAYLNNTALGRDNNV